MFNIMYRFYYGESKSMANSEILLLDGIADNLDKSMNLEDATI